MPRTLRVFSLFVLAAILLFGQEDKLPAAQGGIIGFVSTEAGMPPSGTQVCVAIQTENSRGINCRWSVGTGGGFTIEHLPPGSYGVFAINDGAGYSIDNQLPGQRVTIAANQLWQNISIRMRQPGGIVSGSVTDSVTGKPISTANVSYSGLDCNAGGSRRMKDSGTFDLAVPPSCDLVLTVTALGYRGWIFADPLHPSRPVLNLAAGQKKELEIQLEPLRPGPPSQ